ncbi:hypothetical protein E1288_44910 [Saccharopolyspora elongata]|uniref:Uncharacterized protein n=2 Tax=Saccharopolyspora elongata TaxID=2530387 RepID=A0A4R4XTU0_9PSEU|nr:hypothetical protein E1288_44910 [Saccharopolyspora elongata]
MGYEGEPEEHMGVGLFSDRREWVTIDHGGYRNFGVPTTSGSDQPLVVRVSTMAVVPLILILSRDRSLYLALEPVE